MTRIILLLGLGLCLLAGIARSDEAATAALAAELEQLGLLEAFDARANPGREGGLHVTGMYRVDEERLNRLPAKTIKAMMSRGDLSRVYAHLISLENFAKLLDLSAAGDTSAG